MSRLFKIGIWILIATVPGCLSDQVKLNPEEPVYTFMEVHAAQFFSETDRHVGKVFEERFKFYRIYHDAESTEPSRREQTIRGKTHFTARLIAHYTQVVRIRITPRQEKMLKEKGIQRQNVIKARVRFAGIAPDGSLAFSLLEILD